jgi:phage tail sheath protein FI
MRRISRPARNASIRGVRGPAREFRLASARRPAKLANQPSAQPNTAMPQYVAPGVYVEEVPFRAKSIEGVSTSTAAFVGPTLTGPTTSPPALLTSYGDFERVYGGSGDLGFAPRLNFIAHGVRAFFNEGGQRLYVARVAAAKKPPTLAGYRKALTLLADLPDVSAVAAPGVTEFSPALADGVVGALIAHAEQMKYRVAVLDVPAGRDVAQASAYRAKFDSKFAALYYPWIVTANPGFNLALPGSPPELTLPPSPFICGIYARTDIQRGVAKAPANEIVQSALRFERAVTQADQDVLNPLGINCLRFFVGRGNRVWGARTISSDPEWKYISVRRYFNYLERSIDQGTQWVVFEPNNEDLWAKVRDAIASFLYNEWQSGALMGKKPEEAYFVKCDRTTMTQNDLDNGRLVCLVGVAPLRPAEFVIFRIGQKTADATS